MISGVSNGVRKWRAGEEMEAEEATGARELAQISINTPLPSRKLPGLFD